MTSDQAAARQAAHECLQQDLVAALQAIVQAVDAKVGFYCATDFWTAIDAARNTLDRATV